MFCPQYSCQCKLRRRGMYGALRKTLEGVPQIDLRLQDNRPASDKPVSAAAGPVCTG